MNHSPGPWTHDEMIKEMLVFSIMSGQGVVIGKVECRSTFYEDVKQAEANANMMAASLMMFDALKLASIGISMDPIIMQHIPGNVLPIIKAAMRQAKGEA